MSSQTRVLVVEDEPAIADTLVYALQTEGFLVAWRSTARESLELVKAGGIDFVILDVGLPDMNGFEVCRLMRKYSEVPVLFLTARNSEVDRVVGLELGGDDYVVKPFSPREITARVKAILRRARPAVLSPESVSAVPALIDVDEERCQVRYLGTLLSLTRNEYRLLKTLASKPGRVFSRELLLQTAWEDPEASMDRTVDAHIKSLRAKLRVVSPGEDPIETHRGLGYSLKETRTKD